MREVKKTFWDFIAISGASILAIPIMVISEAIQAQTLGVESYGKIALFYSAISFSFLFGFNWLTTSILKLGKEEFIIEGNLRKTFSSYLFIISIVLIPIIGFLFWIKQFLFSFLEIDFEGSFWIIILGVLSQVFKVLVLEVLKVVRMLKMHSFLNRLFLKMLVLSGIFILSSKAFNFTVTSIVTVIIVSDTIIAIIGFIFIKKHYLFPLVFDKKQIKTMVIFALPFFVGAWTNYLINYVDIYTIKAFLNIESVSIYQAAYKTYLTLQILINSSISVIVTPIIIGMNVLKQEHKLRMYLKRLVPQGVFIFFIFVSLIILFVDYFISMVYGSEFSASVTTLKILIFSLMGTVLHVLTSGFYLAFNMQKMMVLLGIFGGGLNFIGDLLVVRYFGVEGVAWVSAISALIVPSAWLIIINKRMKVKRSLPFLYCLTTLLILFVNISSIGFLIKILSTIFLIIAVFFISRYFNLFEREDVYFLDNVNMPKKVRKGLIKLIELAVK